MWRNCLRTPFINPRQTKENQMRNSFVALVLTVASSGLLAQADSDRTGLPDGAVYVASNGAAGNQILAFDRDDAGNLSFAQTVATGGVGTGGGLGDQGGLVLSRDGRWLVVVNAGSNDLSVFRVKGNALTLTSRTPSAGQLPVSVTIDRDLVYVLNRSGAVGGADSIVGFRLDRRGELHAIPNAAQ